MKMTVMAFRAAMLRRNAVRTILLIGIVVSVLAGLVAMHTLMSPMSGHDNLSGSMDTSISAPMTATAPDGAAATTVGCDMLCGPAHTMAAMMCVLALLFGALVVAAATARGQRVPPPRAGPAPPSKRVDTRLLLPPPDLNVLSISRT